MSLPSINFLHLTVSEIQPAQTFSRRPPAYPDTMGKNNTLTALKGCGVKTVCFNKIFNKYLMVKEGFLTTLVSGWTIRPMFDLSSVSWYNCFRSLTTSRNRLNLTLLYVSQYPRIFYILSSFLNFPLINQ